MQRQKQPPSEETIAWMHYTIRLPLIPSVRLLYVAVGLGYNFGCHLRPRYKAGAF
jgi:hypothetical protein